MQYQRIQGIADTGPPGLGVGNNRFCLCRVSTAINVGMDNASAGFDNRHACVVTHKINQTFGAAWYHEIDSFGGLQNCRQVFALRRCQKHDIRVDGVLGQHFMHQAHHHPVSVVRVAAAFQYAGIEGFKTQGENIKSHIWT